VRPQQACACMCICSHQTVVHAQPPRRARAPAAHAGAAGPPPHAPAARRQSSRRWRPLPQPRIAPRRCPVRAAPGTLSARFAAAPRWGKAGVPQFARPAGTLHSATLVCAQTEDLLPGRMRLICRFTMGSRRTLLHVSSRQYIALLSTAVHMGRMPAMRTGRWGERRSLWARTPLSATCMWPWNWLAPARGRQFHSSSGCLAPGCASPACRGEHALPGPHAAPVPCARRPACTEHRMLRARPQAQAPTNAAVGALPLL